MGKWFSKLNDCENLPSQNGKEFTYAVMIPLPALCPMTYNIPHCHIHNIIVSETHKRYLSSSID